MSTIGKIYSLIPKIMADIKAVGKDRTNTFQKYNFRGIDDLYNAIYPALVKHGVFCVPQVQKVESFEIQGKEKISYRVILTIAHRFYAEDGSYIEVVTVGEGIDTSDKASYKAMSGAMKYAFIELFSIPTEDIEDPETESPEAQGPKHQIKNVTTVGKMSVVAQVQPDDVAPNTPAIVKAGSGVHCEFCKSEVIMHESKTVYICPNAKVKGDKHTRFLVSKLKEHQQKQLETTTKEKASCVQK